MARSMSEREYKLFEYICVESVLTQDCRKSHKRLTIIMPFINPEGICEKEVPAEFTVEEVAVVQGVLDKVHDLDSTLLEANVRADEKQPIVQIESMRGKLMRGILRNYAALEAMKDRRISVVLDRFRDAGTDD